MSKAKPRVGVIGLGIMGGAFARNLLAAGHQVTGYDPVADKLAALTAAGGQALASPAAVIAACNTVILSLPSPAALTQVVNDVVNAPDPGATIALECSTLGLNAKHQAAARLADAGITLLDCPISGTGSQAAVKHIVALASGDEAAYRRTTDVISGFAGTQHYVGEFGAGSRLKLVANTLIALHILAAAEATLLAERAGLDLDLVHEILRNSPAGSAMYDLRGGLMKDGTFEPPLMALDMWQKDMALIADFAATVGAELPLFEAAAPLYAAAAQAFPKADTAAVFRTLRDLS